jgi:hypothetical protein
MAPAEKPSDLSQLQRQLNSKPSLPAKVDYKNLSDIPDSAAVQTPSGFDPVPEKSASDLLKMIEGKRETGPIEEEKEAPVVEEPKVETLDLSDLDLSKDPEPIEPVATEEKPKKKSKEDNFAELRKKTESVEEELKSRDTQIEEYKRKLHEMESTLEKTDFEKSPRFQAEYKAPFDEALNDAVEFAKTYADDPSVAEKALSLKGRDRIDFIDANIISGAAAASFLQKIEKAEQAKSNLENALSNAPSVKQKFIQQEMEQKANMEKNITKTFDRVLGHLANKSDYFRKGDDGDHNSVVDKRVEAARNIILGKASKNDMAVAPFLAVIAKDAVEENAKLKSELAKYKARVGREVAVQPSVKRGTSEVSNETGKPKGALESIRTYFR